MPNLKEENSRILTFGDAIREAFDQALGFDPSVYLIGEGVPDPKNIFGTTTGLQEKYGPKRVMDMPVSENGMTGILIGSAMLGMKPILCHQRIDFSLYAMDQVINNAAKCSSMYGGRHKCPMVIRMIIGKGWGQGNQHSQNLQTLYAHIPGLKVVMPANAYDAKGLLLASVQDPNPVIFIEHRWLHNTTAHVPKERYLVELGEAGVIKKGSDITLVTWSYMTLETLKAAEYLEKEGISVEVVDIKSLSPFDYQTVKISVQKTKRLMVIDAAWKHNGFAGEIIARVAEDSDITLATNPKRITFPDYPSPSTPGLAKYYYPTMRDIYLQVCQMCECAVLLHKEEVDSYEDSRIHDVPDRNFTGPF